MKIPVSTWGSPTNKIIKDILKGKSVSCRKAVKCKTKCRCGDNIWESCWRPEGEENRYLKGALKLGINSLPAQPYCELYDTEKAKERKVCTKEQAEKVCKKIP